MTTPALARRERCIRMVLASEGAYVDSPKDPGGPTKYGVTIRALEAHRGRACSPHDVLDLTLAEAEAIYASTYWPAVKGDDMPAGVDMMMLDAAVNSGRGRAAELLQRALPIRPVDRALGPSTMAAVHNRHPGLLVSALAFERLAFLRTLPTWPTFGAGWKARVDRTAATAKVWADRG